MSTTLSAWIALFAAGLLESAFVVALRASRHFTHLAPSIAAVLCMAVSLALLSVAMRTLPVGVAYAVWTGIGAVCAALVGWILFGEQLSAGRFAGIVAIACGIGLLAKTQ